MKTSNIIFLLLIFGLFASSCGDKPEPIKEPTKSELLTQTWKLVKVTANGSDQPIAGYTIRFTSANSYTATGPLLSITGSGTWAFNSSETAIILNESSEQFRVISLTKERIVLEIDQMNYKSGRVLVRLEFEK